MDLSPSFILIWDSWLRIIGISSSKILSFLPYPAFEPVLCEYTQKMTPAVHSLVFIAADPYWIVIAGNQTIASIILQREWNNTKVLKIGKKIATES